MARRDSRATLMLVLALASACTAAPEKPSEGLIVVATIQPLASLTREVVGDRGTVRCLLPPGASPHTFEPLPRDIAALDGTALLVGMGAGADDWSTRLLAGVGKPPRVITVLELAATDPLPFGGDDDHGAEVSHDPHAWLDPLRMRDAFVPELARTLAAIDPPGAAGYDERASALAVTLTELDDDLRDALASTSSRKFIAYHDSWRYFAERYGLEQVGAIETVAGDEPTAAELAALIARARAENVRAVIMEPQLGQRMARIVAAELGVVPQMADPLGDPTDPARASYASAMRFNASAIARALGGNPP